MIWYHFRRDANSGVSVPVPWWALGFYWIVLLAFLPFIVWWRICERSFPQSRRLAAFYFFAVIIGLVLWGTVKMGGLGAWDWVGS